MFGLGFGEILIILVLALILLGPTRLPDAAKQLGKTLREFKKATDDLKGQFEDELYADHRPARRLIDFEDHADSPGRRNSSVTDLTPSTSSTAAEMVVVVRQRPTPSGSQDSDEPDEDRADVMLGPVFSHTATVRDSLPLVGSRFVAPPTSVAMA